MSEKLHTSRFTNTLNRILVYLFLILFCIYFIYPIFYSAGVTFMDKYSFSKYPSGIIPKPKPFSFRNLKFLLLIETSSQFPVGVWYVNSIVRSSWYLVTAVLTSLICGYVFSRMKFAGRNVAFGVLMVVAMLPPVVTMTPTFLLMAKFPLVGGNDIFGNGGRGFIDTYPAIMLIGLLNLYGTFLMRLSIDRMPKDMEESAFLDGANFRQILFRIVLPAQKAMIAYIAITTVIYRWNDWYIPYVYTSSNYLQTLASGIYKVAWLFIGSYGVPDWPRIISLGFGMTVPCLIIFIIFQRHIVEGLMSTAIKG